jgi:hypothetical protein
MRLVAPPDTASDGSEDPVATDVMAKDASDDGSLDASLGLGRRGWKRNEKGNDEKRGGFLHDGRFLRAR